MAAPKVMVVDDQPINVQLLKRKLEREGMTVIAAHNGVDALVLIKQHLPDIILLDVMMPDMDGIEVCQRLRADPETSAIPVIFITARSAKESKIEGLAVGAVDYITKPIDLDVTLARVQTQLRFVEINRHVKDLEDRLEEARKGATIGAVSQGIAHNLNNLLGVVMGYTDLIKASYDKPLQVKRNVQHVEDAVTRIVNVIKQLSSVAMKTRPPLVKHKLAKLLESASARFRAEVHSDVPISIENSADGTEIETNLEAFEEIMVNVMMNAWEAYDGEARPIVIQVRTFDKALEGIVAEIQVLDRGRGIDPEIRDRMFEPFVGTKRTVGVGMGLTVARHALRSLGGDVSLTERADGGTAAIIIHPLGKPVKREDPT